MLISCTECDKRFVSANQVEEHIKQHEDRTDQNQFEKINKHKLCRYFRNGFCRRGEECNFKHSEEQRNVSKCKRGQECVFFQQNRCHFFHPGYGVQKPRKQNGENVDIKNNVVISPIVIFCIHRVFSSLKNKPGHHRRTYGTYGRTTR